MTRLPLVLAILLSLPTACATTNPSDSNAGSAGNAGNAETASQPTIDDSRVTLGLGQGTQLSDGSRLSYTSLVNDSRCPLDVQCVWAGDAEIALRWKPATRQCPGPAPAYQHARAAPPAFASANAR